MKIFFVSKRSFYYIILGFFFTFLFILYPKSEEQGVLKIYPIEKTILIDPGHGGIDPGANYGDVLEKEITLAIGLELEKQLQEKNIVGILTRDGDYLLKEGPPWKDLQARANLGNQKGVDLLVSIHVNNYTSSLCFGGQVFYNPKNKESKRLAQFIQEEIYTIQPENKRSIFPSENLYLLNALEIPSVLVEVGFIKNEGDRLFLSSKEGQKEMAQVIRDGILRYFQEEMANLSFLENHLIPERPSYQSNQEALLYFMEKHEGSLRGVRVQLPFFDEVPSRETQVEVLLSLLLSGPPLDMGLSYPLQKNDLLSLSVQGERVEVNLNPSIKEDFLGGSLMEEMIILSLTETLKSIPGVLQVKIAIGGEEKESIGGHILLSQTGN